MTKDRTPVIDFHVHLLVKEVLAASDNRTVTTGFGAAPGSYVRAGTSAFWQKMLNPADQLADMDERGIDMSVVTASTVIQGTTWADAKTDAELCRQTNDATAQWVALHPERFIGSFVLPLQDLDLAMDEFERCTHELDFRVANVSSNYKGVYMGEPHYHPFWEAVEAHDVVAWIHPEGITDPWFQKYALWNSAGQSIEEAKVMASMIYDGVMHKFAGLKVIMAHGGGYFPHYMGRLDRNASNRTDTLKNTGGRKPSDFLRSFYYDTCVYDPQVMKTLIDRIGVDRMVMGSDYPVGEKDPVGFLRSCGLEGAQLEQVAGGTARALLGFA